MIRKEFGLTVKALVCVLFVLSLFILPSCKKSPQDTEQPAAVEQTQPATDANDVIAEDAEEPVVETPAATPTPEMAESDSAEKEGWVPIEIELPKPMFVGTPQDAKVENLEKPLGFARPPFLAPPGTTNVALGKPVTSSDPEPIIGELEQITDDDKEASDGSYVELGPMVQYVTVDLEDMYEIYAIIVWHYHMQAHIYFDVVVQVADDPDFITNVRTLFNNDNNNSAGLGVGEDMHYSETNEGKLIDAKGVKARYVRLYSSGNTSDDLNRYIEVAVYGKPVEE